MSATRVLVVDDSFMMRTLITTALEQIPNIVVVGDAESADDARKQVAALRPDVITLDVEMPGMSGIAYLEEIMSTWPIPVIMFSTRTSKGATDTVEALRLGAIGCFPKPQAAPSVMQKTIADIAKCIKKASTVSLTKLSARTRSAIAPINWNGRPLFLGTDAATTSELFTLLSAFPDNCPPTIAVLQNLSQDVLIGLAAKLDDQVEPKVVIAKDGMSVEQGTIYLAPRGESHLIIDGWPDAKFRLLARDPVAGERPSMSLLFASAVKAVGPELVGLIMTNDSADAQRAGSVMNDAKGYVISLNDTNHYQMSHGLVAQPIERGRIAAEILGLCSR